MTRIKTTLFCILTTLTIFPFSSRAEETPATPRRPSVGFLGYTDAPRGPEIAGRLVRDGFNLRRGPSFAGAVTWDQVKGYDVLVVVGLGESASDGSLTEANRQNIALLNRFMEEGGGVLFIPFWYQKYSFLPPMEAFLKPLGLEPLLLHIIEDESAVKEVTLNKLNFGYSEDLAPDSPITRDAKGIWIPVDRRPGMLQASTPLAADKNWKIVARAGENAVARAYNNDLTPLDKPAVPRPPVLATREVGKGRLVVFGVASPQFLWLPTALTALEGVTFEKGLGGKPSSGYVLLRNSLEWLSEPALENPDLGGAGMDKSLLTDPFKTVFIEPFNGRGQAAPQPLPKWSGVVGARTTYSSGKATVNEWVESAKAQGLDYIVFLEEFSKLDEEDLAKLKADCARLTTLEFAAIPGFTIDDEVGHKYFFFGTEFPYPRKELIDPDKRVFRAHAPQYKPQEPFVPGQLSMTVLDYTYTDGGHRMTSGNYLYSRVPFPVFFANAGAAGVITRENGKLVESTPDVLKELSAMGKSPVPLVVDLMDDPSFLQKTPWRTELHLPPATGGINPVVTWANSWKEIFPSNPTIPSITSGPEITLWAMSGPRDYAGGLRGDFVTSDHRWQLHGKVEAEAGLKEVRVYDGPELLRRFLPKGEKSYAFDLDLTHDKQHTLLLQVIDQNGGEAYSGDIVDRNHRLMEFSCSDQNNQLSYSYQTDSKGYEVGAGGNQGLTTPNLRIDTKEISPSGTFSTDKRLGALAFDGGIPGAPSVFGPANVVTDEGLIPSPNVSRSERLLHTMDLAIGQGTYEHNFKDNVEALNIWYTLWSTEPARDFKMRKRNTFFRTNPDRPLAVFLWEIDVELLRDLKTTGVDLAFVRPGEARMWAIHSESGVQVGEWETEADVPSPSRTIEEPLAIGDYVAALNSPLGGAAVFALSDGLVARTSLPAKSLIDILLTGEKTPVKMGQSTKATLLLLGIPRPVAGFTDQFPARSTEVVERFRHEFGLAGKPTGYTVKIDAGSISSQVYILTIDGTKSRAFSGQLTGSPISSLPIRVTGLNDGWSACLYDAKEGKARPVGVFESAAWATVALNGSADLFVGHPVICDQEKLVIQATPMDDATWRVEMHNPTDAEITTTARVNPSLLKRVTAEPSSKELVLPAGTSVVWDFKSGRPE